MTTSKKCPEKREKKKWNITSKKMEDNPINQNQPKRL
jgi:hypothetical protein